MFKFIGAVIGFFLLGRNFLAAFLGFLVGSFIDNFASVKVKGGSTEDVFNYYKQHSGAGSGDFANMLIALSASVMRADGKVIKAELDYVKSFFSQQFGPNFSVAHLQTLKHYVNGGEIPLEQICNDI